MRAPAQHIDLESAAAIEGDRQRFVQREAVARFGQRLQPSIEERLACATRAVGADRICLHLTCGQDDCPSTMDQPA